MFRHLTQSKWVLGKAEETTQSWEPLFKDLKTTKNDMAGEKTFRRETAQAETWEQARVFRDGKWPLVVGASGNKLSVEKWS